MTFKLSLIVSMQSKNRIFAGVFSVLFLVIALFSFSLVKDVNAGNSNVCPSGGDWIKYDVGDPFKKKTYTVDTDKIISEVCVKGGGVREFFVEDGVQSCWRVAGIETNSATVRETWIGDNKGPHCKDISHLSLKVIDKPYVSCSETTKQYGEWSEWQIIPDKPRYEYRERIVTWIDARDSSVICDTKIQRETQRIPYEICSETYIKYGRWSDWMDHPEDETQEYRERVIYIKDSVFRRKLCSTDKQFEYRDKEIVACENTVEVHGEWSKWSIDTEDESREVRSMIIKYMDINNEEYQCSEETVFEYRDRELCEWDDEKYADDPLCEKPIKEDDEDDNGDILGEKDEKVTTVVYAKTGVSDNTWVYIGQAVLLSSTLGSTILLVKKVVL